MAGRWRVAVAFGFIGAMIVGLLLLLLDDGESQPESTPTSTTVALTTTSTTTTTTTVVADSTTTTTADTDARIAEVERIVEDLEIAWYDSVHREDASALSDIVAIQSLYDAAIDAMGNADFLAPPGDKTVEISVHSILLDRADCLVVHLQRDLRPVLGPEALRDLVQILWPRDDGTYRLARTWTNPGDLWQDDCDLMDRSDFP